MSHLFLIVHPASPFVHRLSQDLSPFCRSPRGRGREDVHACYRGARERTSPRVVCYFHAPSSANRYNKKNRENLDAPSIAKDYWRLEENATIKDVLYAVRSDESTHRFVNHSLGNLQDTDVNPFAIREPDMHTKGKQIEYALISSPMCRLPSYNLRNRFTREKAAEYVKDAVNLIRKHSSDS
jgi:hypothetical protein